MIRLEPSVRIEKMNQVIYTLPEIEERLLPVFSEYSIRKAILFGSYAKGCATPNSDIDILVDSGLRGLSFFGLLEDVVTALDKNVDLLDVTQVSTGSEVDNEISNNGVVIYEQ